MGIFVHRTSGRCCELLSCYSCKGSGEEVGFLGNSGLSFVLVRVICTSVQCLDVCTANQDTLRMLFFHSFYILLLFNCGWTRKCRVKFSPALKFPVWTSFMQAQTKSRFKILWFLVQLLREVDFNVYIPSDKYQYTSESQPNSDGVELWGHFDNPSMYSSYGQGIQCWKVGV